MSRRIVIDTNVLVAAVRSKGGSAFKFLSLVGTGRFDIHVSVPLVLEYEAALLKHGPVSPLSERDIDDLLDYLCAVAERQEVFFLWRPKLRDPKDDMVLEIAVAGNCDAIVTYNRRDFAGAEEFDIAILTPAEFLQDIGEL
ncbi:MAG: putative toxin-antitoxin system toxin component, PIN family [Acidobacteriota bacterium]